MSIFKCLAAVGSYSTFWLALTLDTAAAAPIHYDEAVSGDVSFKDLTLGVGLNTISGSDFFTPSGFDGDPFAVIVPDGRILKSATYDFYNLNLLPGSFNLGFGNATFSNSATVLTLYSTNFVSDASPIPMFSSVLALPKGPDRYWLSNTLRRFGDSGGSWDYTWTFEVSAVPVPPALWLFVSGILGLTGIARHNRTA